MKSSPSTYGPSRENRALRASADLYPRSIRTIEASVAFLVLYTAQRLRVYGAAVTQVSRHHHHPLYLSYTQQRLSLRTPPRRHQASSRREAPDCPYEHILFRRIVTTTAATDPPGTGAVYATLDCDLSRRLRSRASPILLPRLGCPRVASKAGRQASEQAASFSAGCGPLYLAPFSRYRHVYYVRSPWQYGVDTVVPLLLYHCCCCYDTVRGSPLTASTDLDRIRQAGGKERTRHVPVWGGVYSDACTRLCVL